MWLFKFTKTVRLSRDYFKSSLMKHDIFILCLAIAFLGQSCGKIPRRDTTFAPQPHALSASADTNVILPPAWAFGIIYGAYTNEEETIDLIDNIIAHDYPIDAFWIDSWIWDWQNQGKGPAKYIDFVADTISYPNMEAMWTFMEQRRIKAGMWVWDCIFKTGNEAAYEDFRSRGFFKNEYIRTDITHFVALILGKPGMHSRSTFVGVVKVMLVHYTHQFLIERTF